MFNLHRSLPIYTVFSCGSQNNAPARRQTGAQRHFRSGNALRVARAHHVKRVHICVVNIQFGWNACGSKTVKIADSFRIKRFAVRHKGICRRKTYKIRRPAATKRRWYCLSQCAARAAAPGYSRAPVGMRIVRTRISRSGSIKRIAAPFFCPKASTQPQLVEAELCSPYQGLCCRIQCGRYQPKYF